VHHAYEKASGRPRPIKGAMLYCPCRFVQCDVKGFAAMGKDVVTYDGSYHSAAFD
jgi:hypothetical protein